MSKEQQYIKVVCAIVVEKGSVEVDEILDQFEYIGSGHGLYTSQLGVEELTTKELKEFKENSQTGDFN